MVSTTVDGIQYMYIRYSAWNSLNIYRGVWDDALKQFKNFAVFATMTTNPTGNNYNNMARLSDSIIRLQTQQPAICDFNVRTGEIIRQGANGGSWSPSSYPFANSFSPYDDPSMIIGASGSGTNWYWASAFTLPVAFNPAGANAVADGFNLIGTPHMAHPSTHHEVTYYTPNNGTITAYKNEGVYIQKNLENQSDEGSILVKQNGEWKKVFN